MGYDLLMTNDPNKPEIDAAQTDRSAKAKKARTHEPTVVTVTELAELLNLSRPHVSRHYKEWGFERVPWSTNATPFS